MSGHSTVFSPKTDNIYIFGGYNGQVLSNTMFIFNVISEELNVLKEISYEETEETKASTANEIKPDQWFPFPKPRASHACCIDSLNQDRMYIHGGTSSNT